MDNITWLGHASFLIADTNGKKIYFIDPYELPELGPQKADLIFITHAHQDHLSEGDISNILKPETTVIATSDSLTTLNVPDSQKFHVTPNQEYELQGVKFETVPAYNTHPDKQGFHPKSNHWVGYILEVNGPASTGQSSPGGMKIYHAGDCDFMPEMKEFAAKKLDIAMLPIGGHYTMDVDEAIEAANVIAAKTTIPMHYRRLLGDGYKEAEEKFKKGVINSEVVILEEIS